MIPAVIPKSQPLLIKSERTFAYKALTATIHYLAIITFAILAIILLGKL